MTNSSFVFFYYTEAWRRHASIAFGTVLPGIPDIINRIAGPRSVVDEICQFTKHLHKHSLEQSLVNTHIITRISVYYTLLCYNEIVFTLCLIYAVPSGDFYTKAIAVSQASLDQWGHSERRSWSQIMAVSDCSMGMYFRWRREKDKLMKRNCIDGGESSLHVLRLLHSQV